jgi:hypothetical protein
MRVPKILIARSPRRKIEQAFEQSGLAGTVNADQAEEFPARDLERDLAQRSRGHSSWRRLKTQCDFDMLYQTDINARLGVVNSSIVDTGFCSNSLQYVALILTIPWLPPTCNDQRRQLFV